MQQRALTELHHDSLHRKNGLQVAKELDQLLRNEILPGLSIDEESIWQGFTQVVAHLSPKNTALLLKRHHIQQKLGSWHQ